MKDQFEQLKDDVIAAATKIADRDALERLRVEFLGRKGKLAELMKGMATLAGEERKLIGAVANEVKSAVEAAFVEAEKKAERGERYERGETERVDVTEPAIGSRPRGHLHPVTQVREDLEDLFTSMGFIVADGPELESDYFNFTALNIPPTHPARDMQDTFYVEGAHGSNGEVVMRTHTSSQQIRAMRAYGTPLRTVTPGRCFRNEATDVRHEHTFHQLDGMVVDKGISFAHMKGVLGIVAKHLYGPETKIRLRPKFYPFVEPGVNGEVTCYLCKGEGCRLCKKSGWLEVFGAGMIHPNVLREGGVDPGVYSGFAFGFGLTRLVMLKYGIDDIRHLEGGDLRFLNQF
ncbi:phenylalanine--tRNA ligase subunit alpha [Candidatus Uhrbacteria bacterium RIFOXYB12_FULL_58_10]|nr:MAG: phenylalanine--tRNA ligase subunit alpha [Candidatus Uhrbacteria bacterium RIFOXYB12_FULL_58_10]